MKFYPDSDKIDELQWASLRKDFSFGVKWIYLIGGRGWGKTYSIKRYVFKRFRDKGKKFAWCRTTDAALEQLNTTTFFSRVIDMLKELGFKSWNIKGNTIYLDGKEAGYLYSVSTFYKIKGSDYFIDTIVWDEFMRAKGERPLPDRVEKFNDLVESLGRENASRVICMSNSTNQYDDSLAQYDIKLKEYGCYLYRERNAVIHYMKPSKKYMERKHKALAAQNMSKEQLDYAYSNKFTEYDDYEKSNKLVYRFSIVVGDNSNLTVYSSPNGLLYVNKREVSNPKLYTLDNLYVNSRITKMPSSIKKFIQSAYNNGLMKFYDGYCRSAFQDLVA